MFNSLKNFFNQQENSDNNLNEDLNILCGLMIETAYVDGKIDQSEINKISNVLIDTFKEDPKNVEGEIKKCLDELDDSKSFHYFTSKINKSFSDDKKILLLEMLWEIILEDGNIHDYESSLMRRLSGLLYISDMQCGIAKKKALKKIEEIK